ncbi:sister chromatid cohesion protein PDS5 homolog D-like isoform X2 [Cucumis melo]|uniref:Sister chromatid cohesion protein PDS5 homolog D-like isoform X2 n=1 Tax=Cucumis melo TaxID=3656 RepID=A0ABM3L3F0_CUCME|nr:sister chromatid cohesion protein PDS5 homolog D-like isoform X2 [Cucumis melo]
MNLSEKELEEQLKEIGSELLKPPSSIDALLKALDKAECLLTNVEQSPTRSMRDTLLPLMKALISDKLLKHSEEDVKITATSCITEITRITAPDAPYDDEKMKVIFQLTLEAFRKLSNVSGRCYTKALSILDAVAKVRLCLVMLDLECDNLILEMFQSFLKLIRSNHPTAVFSAMEAIMTNVLDESEDISLDLLRLILASVRKENQEAASISWKLAERVMSNCATKVQPYLMGAVHSLGASLDDYAPIVMSICRNGTDNIDAGNHLENEKSEEKGTNSNEPMLVTLTRTPDASIEENPRTDAAAASESLISSGTVAAGNDDILKASKNSQKCSEQSNIAETMIPDNVESMKAEDTLDSVPKKRGRKPNSLMNPDEGYEHYWIGKGRERSRLSNHKKSNDQKTKFSPVSLRIEKVSLPTKVEKVLSGHAAEKQIQSEAEVVKENMTKMEENTQVRSKKPKVGKSSKDKTIAVSPVSPRVESLPTEEEKKSPGHAEEKHIQSEDEVVNENMKKMEEKSWVRSRKSKVGNSRKDEGTKFSSVSSKVKKASLSTEVRKESSAHTEEKRIQVEDEVVNENMEKIVKKAQARSRKSTVGKSSKLKATKFSSVSPRVQKDPSTTEVEKVFSAHTEEKPLQSEDEVVNENMEKMVEEAQASSRKSTVGKSRKDKVTKFSSISPKVQRDTLTTEVEKESSAHAEEKPLQSEDEVVNEHMKMMEEKTQSRSKKSKAGKCKEDKAIHDPRCVISEEKVSVPSDYKEKRSVHLVMKLRVKSTNGDGSVVQKDVIVKSIDTNMDKNIHKPSTCEVKDSRSAKLDGDDSVEETPQAEATRRHAIVEKEVMDISSAGEELVGRRIKVWWPLDRMFYEGVVRSFDPVKKKHQVSYDDGDEEILNLKKQRYELIGADPLLVGGEEKDVPETEASLDIVDCERGKGKTCQNQTRRKRPILQPEGLELQPRGNLTLNLQSQVRKLPIVPCPGSLLSPMNQWTMQGVSIIVQKEMIKSS